MRLFRLVLFPTAWAIVLTAGAAPDSAPERPLLTTVAQIQSQPQEAIDRSPPVSIAGVVTSSEPIWGTRFYLQDETGGILAFAKQDPGVQVGDEVAVKGVVNRGTFDPVVAIQSFEIRGRKPLPQAVPVAAHELLAGGLIGRRVELTGWVRSARWIAPGLLGGELSTGANRVAFRVSQAGAMDPAVLIAAKARLTGVAVSVHLPSEGRQLVDVRVLAANSDDFVVTESEPADVWASTPEPLNRVLVYQRDASPGRRIKVAAIALGIKDEYLYLHDGRSGLVVRADELAGIQPGDFVEAVGFPEVEHTLPILDDAQVRPARGLAPPKPLRAKILRVTNLAIRPHHGDFVTVSGRLLDKLRQPIKDAQGATIGARLVLALQSTAGVFNAEYEGADSEAQFARLAVDSVLDLEGVCLVDISARGTPVGFRLLVFQPENIRVVQSAPWFTQQRLLGALCVALVGLLVIAQLAIVLLRRNNALGAELRARQAVTSERARLARDLHDSLEQGLTAIDLQLERVTRSAPEIPTVAQQAMSLARQLVDQCHKELRQTLWDLRTAISGPLDLESSLRHVGEQLSGGRSTAVTVRSSGHSRPLPPLVGENLVRIGQEAITNAVKHAQAGRIEVAIAFEADRLLLSVSDDGVGLPANTANESPAGHFGLVGMRERARRIGGALHISPGSQGGAEVRIVVPLPASLS